MALVWVIGSGGLLGGALKTELTQSEDTLFEPITKIIWSNPSSANELIKQAARQFCAQAAKGPWTIYWAAGTGNMHSTEQALAEETHFLETLVSSLLHNSSLNLNVGAFVFASSAGAIYAGAQEEVISEATNPTPINAYGREKLQQESLVNQLNQNGQGASVISCRITTLYGFKSKDGNQQGLIAQIVRKILKNQVVHIYVPLETMRDYISAKNAAKQMIEATATLEKTPGIHMHIIASGISTSIAQILAILKQICKRNLRVITQADEKSAQYQRVMQFKSIVNPNLFPQNQNNLIEGISDLLDAIQKDGAKNGWG